MCELVMCILFLVVCKLLPIYLCIAHRQTKSVIRNIQNLVKITNLYTNTYIEYIKMYLINVY